MLVALQQQCACNRCDCNSWLCMSTGSGQCAAEADALEHELALVRQEAAGLRGQVQYPQVGG
jgi:hypothetical protein